MTALETDASNTALLQFDSDALPPAERVPAYRDLYNGGADAVQLGAGFRVRLNGWSLDRVTLFERHLNDVGHDRTRARAVADAFDHFVLTFVVAGDVEVDTGQGFVTIVPGSGIVVDARQSMRNRLRNAHVYTIRIARDQFDAVIGPSRKLHGMRMPAERTALLIDYLQAMARRIDTFDISSAGHAVDALFALIMGAFEPMTDAVDLPAVVRDAARFSRVRALIDVHIADPDLGPDMVVERADLSRATLYRLFKPHGGITAHIRVRRLQLLLMALVDELDTRSFAEMAIAWGFRSEAHASRLFQQRYGVRPGQYRSAWNAQADPALPLREMRLLDATIG
jgi:AraC-like DNA-binding protein